MDLRIVKQTYALLFLVGIVVTGLTALDARADLFVKGKGDIAKDLKQGIIDNQVNLKALYSPENMKVLSQVFDSSKVGQLKTMADLQESANKGDLAAKEKLSGMLQDPNTVGLAAVYLKYSGYQVSTTPKMKTPDAGSVTYTGKTMSEKELVMSEIPKGSFKDAVATWMKWQESGATGVEKLEKMQAAEDIVSNAKYVQSLKGDIAKAKTKAVIEVDGKSKTVTNFPYGKEMSKALETFLLFNGSRQNLEMFRQLLAEEGSAHIKGVDEVTGLVASKFVDNVQKFMESKGKSLPKNADAMDAMKALENEKGADAEAIIQRAVDDTALAYLKAAEARKGKSKQSALEAIKGIFCPKFGKAGGPGKAKAPNPQEQVCSVTHGCRSRPECFFRSVSAGVGSLLRCPGVVVAGAGLLGLGAYGLNQIFGGDGEDGKDGETHDGKDGDGSAKGRPEALDLPPPPLEE